MRHCYTQMAISKFLEQLLLSPCWQQCGKIGAGSDRATSGWAVELINDLHSGREVVVSRTLQRQLHGWKAWGWLQEQDPDTSVPTKVEREDLEDLKRMLPINGRSNGHIDFWDILLHINKNFVFLLTWDFTVEEWLALLRHCKKA